MHQPPAVFAVVDLETTGLPTTDYRTGAQDFHRQKGADHPVYITEVSALVVAGDKVVDTFDRPVRIPDEVQIPDAVVELNGITKEYCNAHGDHPGQVVAELEDTILKHHCRTLVGHNLFAFDAQLLSVYNLATYFTMHDTKLVAAAWMAGQKCGQNENLGHFYGRASTIKRSKSTSLQNLYNVFVSPEITQTHRALADCIMARELLSQFVDRGIWSHVFAK